MPEVNDRNVQDNLIISINTNSEKYTVNYIGLCEEELVNIYNLESASKGKCKNNKLNYTKILLLLFHIQNST